MTQGWIYILSNQSMPGLVKIGFSLRHPSERAKDLDGTWTPTPFNVIYGALVFNPNEVEQLLHREFSSARVSDQREFFKLSETDAVNKTNLFLQKSGIQIKFHESSLFILKNPNLDKTISNEVKERIYKPLNHPTKNEWLYTGKPFWKIFKLAEGRSEFRREKYSWASPWFLPIELHNHFKIIFGDEIAEYGLFSAYLLLRRTIPFRFFNISTDGIIRGDANTILDIALTHTLNCAHQPTYIIGGGNFTNTAQDDYNKIDFIIKSFELKMPKNYGSLPQNRHQSEISAKWYSIETATMLFQHIIKKIVCTGDTDFPIREVMLINLLCKKTIELGVYIETEYALDLLKRISEGSISNTYLISSDTFEDHRIQLQVIYIFINTIIFNKLTAESIDLIALKIDHLFSASINDEKNSDLFIALAIKIYSYFKICMSQYARSIIFKIISSDFIFKKISLMASQLIDINIEFNSEDLLDALSHSRYSENHYDQNINLSLFIPAFINEKNLALNN
jgi:hypothetical protein